MMINKLVFYLILKLLIEYTICQIPGAVYEKVSVESNVAQNGSPYGNDIKNPRLAPTYYETIWGFISVPPIMTVCQYIQPITLSIGNLNSTDLITVEFSCNEKLIEGDSKVMTQYGILTISNSITVAPICEAFANLLNEITPNKIQTYSYTNLTYYITNDMIENLVPYFSVAQHGLDNQKSYDWLSNHIYSEVWYNITNDLGLSKMFSSIITIPLKYKVFIPDDILPNNFVIGTNNDHYYVDWFNITIADVTNSNENYNQELWIPKNGLGGFIPLLVPVYQLKVIPYINNVTKFFNDAAVTWGYTNIPLTVTPARVIPPTRMPETSKIKCSSNYDFYYPTKPYTVAEIQNETEVFKDLTFLLSNRSSSIYQRNTIQTYGFFNKFIAVNNPEKEGILKETGVPFSMIDGNFIGGCYYNGTYPLVPSIENSGMKDVGRCSVETSNTSTRYKSPFYPPPLKYEGYFKSLIDQPGIMTNIYQTVSYVQNGGGPSLMSDSNKNIVGKYPGISIVSQLFYGVFIQGPRLIWQSPYFLNPNNPLNPIGSFYAISQQYINKIYGSFNTPGGGTSCRGARMLPLPSEMSEINITWQCYTSRTPVSLLYATTTLKDLAFDACMNKTTTNLLNCLKTERKIPSTLTTSAYNGNNWSVKLESKDYVSTTPILFIQNNTSPLIVNGYSPNGWWIETPTYPNSYEQWFLKAQTCSYLSEIPIIPTEVPLVFNIKSVIRPWDQIKNSHYFGTIPYLNDTTTFSIEIQVNETNYFKNQDELVTFKSYLICDGYHSLTLETRPLSVKVVDLMPPETLTVSALIKPYSLFSEQNINCFVTFYIIPDSVKNSITPGTFGSLGNQIPTPHPKGIGEYIYYVNADMPPLMDDIVLLIPNPGKTSISDTIYIKNPKITFSSPEQSSLFSSIGIIASSDPILKSTSKILILGDQLQLFQQSIRLPSIVPVWYIFLKAATSSNSACLIPCDSSIKNHYIMPYCSFGRSPICPHEKVFMSKGDSLEQIEELIAVATHPISYLSLIDVLQIGISLFSQPITKTLVWNDYFEVLFEMLIEQPKTPTAVDFSASKIMVFTILNIILNKVYENPTLKIDTIRPFNSIINNTLNAECSNSPGFKYLLLETIDLLVAVNGWEFLSNNKQYLYIINLLLQSIGNRLSFFNFHGMNFDWFGMKSNIDFQVKTFSKYELKSGINMRKLKIPPFSLSSINKYQLVESIFMLENPKYYDHSLSNSYWIPSCTNNTMTISLISYPTDIIKNLIHRSLSTESYIIAPIISATFYSCSIDYNILDLPSPVIFSIELKLDVAVNITSLNCGVKQGNKWISSYCETYHTYNDVNPRKSFIQCQCRAIGDYALIGQVSPLNKFQVDTTPWPGFDGDFGGIVPNVSDIKPFLGNIGSGFIFYQGQTTIKKNPNSNIEDGQIGRYSVNYRRGNNITNETYGLLQEQYSNNGYTTLDYDFIYSWEPVSNNYTSNLNVE